MKFSLERMARLPVQLLVSSFVLLSITAIPVESTSAELLQLTPDNFKSTISQGAWFIEHYSPYCGHCKHFAPTWQQLVDEIEAMPDPGVKLAQVNCAAHGDLCTQNGVNGYPQMNLYNNGHFIETFKKARSIENLHEFLTPYTKEWKSSDQELKEDEATLSVDSEAPLIPGYIPNPKGAVLSLDPSNFQKVMGEGPMFVKFFAPWCGHCKKLAPTWTQLALSMKEKLTIAEINCEAFSSLCKSQGVTGFPMLFYYSGGSGAGGRQTEYTGGRKFDQLKKFADDTVAPALLEVSDDDYDKLVEENDVLYLLLHSVGDRRQVDQVSQTVHILLGSPSVYTSSSAALRARFPLPATYEHSPVLLAVKDHEPASFTSVFRFPTTSEASGEALASWLLANRLPTALELTQDTFQSVMNAPNRPLVVLAAVDPNKHEEEIKKVRRLGAQWRKLKFDDGVSESQGRDVVFTWMDADKWAKWMKNMYGIKAKHLPAIVIAEHKDLLYYDKDPRGRQLNFFKDSIFPTLQAAMEGTLSYKHSENFMERMIRYFNNLINYIEVVVRKHPYKTAAFFGACLIAFIIAVKRMIESDISATNQYPHKLSRLD